MDLTPLVLRGRRIRHRDWPPYHFAEVRPSGDGSALLYRVSPSGQVELLPALLGKLHEQAGWSLIDQSHGLTSAANWQAMV